MPRIRDSNNDAKISNAGRYVFSPFLGFEQQIYLEIVPLESDNKALYKLKNVSCSSSDEE